MEYNKECRIIKSLNNYLNLENEYSDSHFMQLMILPDVPLLDEKLLNLSSFGQ